MRVRDRLGVTRVDVLCLLLATGLIAALVLPTLDRVRCAEPRVSCASRLRQIGVAIEAYARANKGRLPRTIMDEAVEPVPTEYTGVGAGNPFGQGGPRPNDVTAALYLLVRDNTVATPDFFICPSTLSTVWKQALADPTAFSNFPGRVHLTYGYSNPYLSARARELAGNRTLTLPLDYDFAVAADMGPGPSVAAVASNAPRAQIISANSANHGGDGQNVLYGDGHVDWSQTPFCGMPRPTAGVPRDNIYAFGVEAAGRPSAGTRGSPVDEYDSVILPTADLGPQPAAEPLRRWLVGNPTIVFFGVVALASVILLAFVAAWRRRRHKSSGPPAPFAPAGAAAEARGADRL